MTLILEELSQLRKHWRRRRSYYDEKEDFNGFSTYDDSK